MDLELLLLPLRFPPDRRSIIENLFILWTLDAAPSGQNGGESQADSYGKTTTRQG